MKWRVLVWAAGLIAAVTAVILGVVAVTAGLAAASGLAGVIAGFCELVAVALAVIGWSGRHRPTTGAAKEWTSTSAPSAERPALGLGSASSHSGSKYEVTVGDNAQDFMIGDNNVLNIDHRHSHGGRAYRGTEESG